MNEQAWDPTQRPDWDTYFMNIAIAVSARSNCLSAGKGAVIVKDKQIVSTGYSGTPRNTPNCVDGGCQRCSDRHANLIASGEQLDRCICSHAEENAIVQASYHGVSTKGGTMYTTHSPCLLCTKMIINAGIERVVAKYIYPADESASLLETAGVTLDHLPETE